VIGEPRNPNPLHLFMSYGWKTIHMKNTRAFFKTTLIAASLSLISFTSQAADISSRNLKMPIVNATDHPQGLAAKVFVDEVAKHAGTKVKTNIVPTGTLGGAQQVGSAMQGGTIEISMMSPAQIVGTIPEFVALDFPFSFKN